MGHLEHLIERTEGRWPYPKVEPLKDGERRREVMQEIRAEWEKHKAECSQLHDRVPEDNGLEMLVHYLIERGVL